MSGVGTRSARLRPWVARVTCDDTVLHAVAGSSGFPGAPDGVCSLVVPLSSDRLRGGGCSSGWGQRPQCCQWPWEPSLESPAGSHSPDASGTGAQTPPSFPTSPELTAGSLGGFMCSAAAEGGESRGGGWHTALPGHLRGAGRHPAEGGGGCARHACPAACRPPWCRCAGEAGGAASRVAVWSSVCYLRTSDVVGSVTGTWGELSVQWRGPAHPGLGKERLRVRGPRVVGLRAEYCGHSEGTPSRREVGVQLLRCFRSWTGLDRGWAGAGLECWQHERRRGCDPPLEPQKEAAWPSP